MTGRSLRNPVWLVAIAVLLGVFALYGRNPTVSLSSGPIIATLADGRAGNVRFESHDAHVRRFQSGPIEDKRVIIAGELIMPAQASGRVPAAVLLHGSDGLSDHQFRYARALADWGIAAFVVDSFGSRGVKNTIGNQDAVSALSMLIDAHAALKLLATHPEIDPDRIALIGWSKGGMAADWLSRRRYRDRLASDGRRFAAHVAFYSWCGEQDFRIEQTGAPLLFLLGDLDDWSGAKACVDHAKRLAAAGYDARAIVYPNAHHGFDYAGRFRRAIPGAIGWANCAYFVRDDGFVIAKTGRFERWPNLKRYLQRCTRSGAHVGSNAEARDRALLDLHDFLSRALRP